MPRGQAGTATRSRRRTPSAASLGSTAGGTATLERTAAATVAASRQIKPVFEFTSQRYAFAVMNNTYQAVMQHGSGWLPIANIPGIIVADWLIEKGLLKPLGFMATNGTTSPDRATRPARNRSQTVSNPVSTGNRV